MDKKIEQLGQLSGKVLVFGGVYSNLQALHALILKAEALKIPANQCINTGDLIGYCAQPEETVRMFQNWNAKSILGNVEQQLINDEDDCGCDFTEGSRCDGFSKLWYPYAKGHLSAASIDFLKTIPDHIQFQLGNKSIAVVHGSYTNISEFIFKSTSWHKKNENFTHFNCDVVVAGHCGLPFLDKKEGKTWVNPGVIGMPANNGSAKVWYAILEIINNELQCTHHELDYDYKTTNQLMLKNHLPKAYAETIVTGIWDNTEILPKEETALQGLDIII